MAFTLFYGSAGGSLVDYNSRSRTIGHVHGSSKQLTNSHTLIEITARASSRRADRDTDSSYVVEEMLRESSKRDEPPDEREKQRMTWSVQTLGMFLWCYGFTLSTHESCVVRFTPRARRHETRDANHFYVHYGFRFSPQTRVPMLRVPTHLPYTVYIEIRDQRRGAYSSGRPLLRAGPRPRPPRTCPGCDRGVHGEGLA